MQLTSIYDRHLQINLPTTIVRDDEPYDAIRLIFAILYSLPGLQIVNFGGSGNILVDPFVLQCIRLHPSIKDVTIRRFVPYFTSAGSLANETRFSLADNGSRITILEAVYLGGVNRPDEHKEWQYLFDSGINISALRVSVDDLEFHSSLGWSTASFSGLVHLITEQSFFPGDATTRGSYADFMQRHPTILSFKASLQSDDSDLWDNIPLIQPLNQLCARFSWSVGQVEFKRATAEQAFQCKEITLFVDEFREEGLAPLGTSYPELSSLEIRLVPFPLTIDVDPESDEVCSYIFEGSFAC